MKKPLLWAFAAGSVSIVVIRSAFPGFGGAVVAALLAVAVVVALGLYYWKSKVKQHDRAGDDLYYLGLLLTLVSLMYALVSLFIFRDASDVQARVDLLVGNFGIALLSTVVGILGRVLLQDASDERLGLGSTQSKDSSDEVREAGRAQEEMSPADFPEPTADMLQMRRQLREAADAFAHFTRVTLSHADHVKSHTQQLLDDFNQHMAAVAERGLEDTGAVWRRVGEAMRQDSEGMLRNIEAAVSDATERTAESWRGLVGQIESASAAARNRLEADALEMRATLERLERANGSLGSLAGALDDAQRHVAMLAEKASAATAALDANATDTLAVQQTLVEGSRASQAAALESFSTATAALTDAVRQQVAEQGRALQRTVEDFDAATQAQRQRSEGAINALIASLSATQQDLAGLGRAASGAVAGAESRIAEILRTFEALSQGAKEQQEASLRAWQEAASQFARDAREHLAGEVDAWHELLDRLNTAEGAQRLSAETSRLTALINRLDGLLKSLDRRKP